jgi:hypothetical protein
MDSDRHTNVADSGPEKLRISRSCGQWIQTVMQIVRIWIQQNDADPDLDNGSRPICKCCGFGSGKKDADLNLVDTGSRP